MDFRNQCNCGAGRMVARAMVLIAPGSDTCLRQQPNRSIAAAPTIIDSTRTRTLGQNSTAEDQLRHVLAARTFPSGNPNGSHKRPDDPLALVLGTELRHQLPAPLPSSWLESPRDHIENSQAMPSARFVPRKCRFRVSAATLVRWVGLC